MFKLVIQDDEGKTTVVPLIRDEITIGRKEGNTIRLTERNVSRKHAKISRANGAVAIEDLGSYNGVRVNGTKISQRTVLSVSDRVQIGDYLIELKAEGAEMPVPYEDARTQPIERLDAAQLARAATPLPMTPVLALADTDPGARAATAVPMTATTGHARLVVLSSNFAGREFQLTKQQMVIGRTDENDVVINHRSISRNHAKVVREPDTGRYTIMDLQSSNGVRVNNEDYGKVELRRGDMVDLGHVRLRFVDPGEDFVFGRDAQIIDVPTGGKKGWIFALVGLVVVGGIVVVVAASGGGGKKKPDDLVASGSAGSARASGASDRGGSGSSVEAAAPDAAADVAVGSGTGTDSVGPGTGSSTGNGSASGAVDTAQVAQLMAEARTAMEASKWAEASNAAVAALKLEPDNADAKGIADQAKRELTSESEYLKFVDAIQRKQYEQAVARFEKIGADSVYKNKARDLYDQMHTQYAVDKKAQGQALARAKKCKDLRKLASDAGRVFPDVGETVSNIACEEQVAGGGGGSSGSGGGSSGSGGGSATGGGGDTGGKNASELLSDAEAAAKTSQWARAMKLAEQSIGAKADGPTKARAAMVAALAACNLKNQSKAKTYYSMATPTSKTLVRQRCLSNGIEVQ